MDEELMSSVSEEEAEVTEVTLDESEGQEVAAPAQEEPLTEEEQNGEEPGNADREIPNEVWKKARQRAEAEARRRMDETNAAFAKRFEGRVNPVTGKPISSAMEYLEAIEAQEQARLNAQLQEKGIDPALLEKAISANPKVRQAEQILAQQQQAEVQRMLEDDLKKVHAMDSTVNTLNDLANVPEYEEIMGLVKEGYRLDHAYKISCFDRLAGKKAAAAHQSAINAAKSKSHLQTTQGSAEKAGSIPAGEIAKWKEWFPGKSAEELHRLYEKVHNN